MGVCYVMCFVVSLCGFVVWDLGGFGFGLRLIVDIICLIVVCRLGYCLLV